MSEVVTDEQVLEEASKQFLENVEALDDLSRKVSREGLRRVFMAVTRFPYTGDNLQMNNEHETKLLTHALYIKGLSDQITKLSKEDFKEAAVDEIVENTVANLQGEANG